MGTQKIFDVEGHAHFTTLTVRNRIPLFENAYLCALVVENLKYYREKFGFRLLAYVILPDHLHLIVLPKFGTEYADIIRDFKKGVAFAIIEKLSAAVTIAFWTDFC